MGIERCCSRHSYRDCTLWNCDWGSIWRHPGYQDREKENASLDWNILSRLYNRLCSCPRDLLIYGFPITGWVGHWCFVGCSANVYYGDCACQKPGKACSCFSVQHRIWNCSCLFIELLIAWCCGG